MENAFDDFPSKRSSKISFQTSPKVRHQFRRKLRQLHSGNRWCLSCAAEVALQHSLFCSECGRHFYQSLRCNEQKPALQHWRSCVAGKWRFPAAFFQAPTFRLPCSRPANTPHFQRHSVGHSPGHLGPRGPKSRRRCVRDLSARTHIF